MEPNKFEPGELVVGYLPGLDDPDESWILLEIHDLSGDIPYYVCKRPGSIMRDVRCDACTVSGRFLESVTRMTREEKLTHDFIEVRQLALTTESKV